MPRWDAIIRDYRSDAPRRAAEDRQWSDPQLSIKDAIRRACRSMLLRGGSLVQHDHQWRLKPRVIEDAEAVLLGCADDIASAATFDALFDVVDAVVRPIFGAGEMYIYDVASRIGLYLGLHPTSIYLHRGTREGARALGIDVKGKRSIPLSDLPVPLRVLSPAEAEDVLCIYKGFFKSEDAPATPRVCGRAPARQRGCRRPAVC